MTELLSTNRSCKSYCRKFEKMLKFKLVVHILSDILFFYFLYFSAHTVGLSYFSSSSRSFKTICWRGMGFEPTRAELNGTIVHGLNHSVTPPISIWKSKKFYIPWFLPIINLLIKCFHHWGVPLASIAYRKLSNLRRQKDTVTVFSFTLNSSFKTYYLL